MQFPVAIGIGITSITPWLCRGCSVLRTRWQSSSAEAFPQLPRGSGRISPRYSQGSGTGCTALAAVPLGVTAPTVVTSRGWRTRGGLPGPELGGHPQYPDCDRFIGTLPLAEPFAVLDAGDDRMVGTLDVMEELGTSVEAVREREVARQQQELPPTMPGSGIAS